MIALPDKNPGRSRPRAASVFICVHLWFHSLMPRAPGNHDGGQGSMDARTATGHYLQGRATASGQGSMDTGTPHSPHQNAMAHRTPRPSPCVAAGIRYLRGA